MRGLDPRRPLPFVFLCLIAFIVARFLGVAAHETLGHGLLAALVGGTFFGVYVSPVTGFAFVFLPPAVAEALRVLVVLGGIAVELALGTAMFVMYRRARTVVGRLFVLTLLEVLLVYSLAYLAFGPFAGGVDPTRAVAVLELPYLAYAFLVVGLLWAVVIAFAISREVVRLVASGAPVRRQAAYVGLFWFAPLPLGALPNLVLAVLAPIALLAYVALFVFVGLGLWAAVRLLSQEDGSPGKTSEPPRGHLSPLAVAFLLVLPAWGFFGLTGETADNLLFAEPPLRAEREFASSTAINVGVHLAANLSVSMEFRLKGVPKFESPLERRALASYEDRADFTFWAPSARALGIAMTNGADWNVTSYQIERQATLWFDGGERGNPRVVVLDLAQPSESSRFLQVIRLNPNGTDLIVLTIQDPFRHLPTPCPGCFLDEVNLTWPESARFGNATVKADGAKPLIGSDPGTSLRFARFRARSPEEASAMYVLRLTYTP